MKEKHSSARSRGAFIASWLGGSLLTAALLLTFHAHADGDAGTDGLPRLMPYHGHIARGGAGFDGPLSLTFSLYDAETNGTARWSETQTVQVHAGEFSAILGGTSASSQSALTAEIETMDALWVGVTLHTSAGDVAFAERKRVSPLPYAAVAPAMVGSRLGATFTLNSTLTNDAAGANGPLTLADSQGHAMSLDGDGLSADGLLYLNYRSKAQVWAHGDLAVHGGTLTVKGGETVLSAEDERLVLNHGVGNEGQPSEYYERTYFDGPVQINGDFVGLTTTSINFNSCEYVSPYDADGSTNAPEYCPSGKAVAGLVVNNGFNGGKTITKLRCCNLSVTVH